MKIFLVRHADAIDNGFAASDEYRYITSKGRITTSDTAESLKKKLKSVDKIFTSPLIRAVQTAEIFAGKLKFGGDVILANELKNESSISSLQNLISENYKFKKIMLVGHEPKMSILVKAFTGKKEINEFGKSSVCFIEYDLNTDSGKFKWYFDSKKMEFSR